MYTHNPLLLCDFYKVCHQAQYPKGFTKIVSPYTPRLSRLHDVNYVTQFGAQAFCQEYLIKVFNTYFFERPEEEVVEEYVRILHYTIGDGAYNENRIRDLHRLGYLPIQVCAVPEGMRTKIGVPQIEISNTHPDFAWLTNAIETLISSYMWHIQIAAEVGYRYRKIVDKWVERTCDNSVDPRKVLGDFSMRGQHSPESAIKASGAWCLSFDNTATVPAIMWLEDNYKCNCATDKVAYGAISFEHSTVTSNYAIDGNEETLLKRALTEIYPNSNFSFLTDSYDHDNFIQNVIPACKKEILEHNGTILFRGDSGDPVEVMAGIEYVEICEEDWDFFCTYPSEWVNDCFGSFNKNTEIIVKHNDEYIKVIVEIEYGREEGPWSGCDYTFIEDQKVHVLRDYSPTVNDMGMIWWLDKYFGHTINSKGYKVLNSHVKGIYGDSITPPRATLIYDRLARKGYAINNVVLGVGSFSFMCLEEPDYEGSIIYKPYTRDTFGVAIKATYAEDKDGNPIMVYKQPKALAWKKSQKGCCIVSLDGESYTDEHTFAEVEEARKNSENLLKVIFRNGEMIKTYTLEEARNNMYPGGKIK